VTRFGKKILVAGIGLLALLCGAAPPPVKIVDGRLTADGRELRLRGINWGWWHHQGTCYGEEHMRRMAEWGSNAVRLTFYYQDVADAGGNWNEERFAKVDEVVRWAERHHQYVILDMHEVPGGQNPAVYCEGGRNRIWTSPDDRRKFIALWCELALRYRGNPTVAAYEIINEPCTEPRNPQLVAELNRETVAAIRRVDPDKVIVVSGDNWSYSGQLTDDVRIDDPGILYTVHFYEDAFPGGWQGNAGGKDGISGTHDWTRFELPLKPGANVTEIAVQLRSVDNGGAAWFDDLELIDETGRAVRKLGFDRDAEGFKVERPQFGKGDYDPAAGHAGPGSLRIGQTKSYSGWIGPRWPVESGRRYRLAGWIKLENGTGSTYLGAALFGKNRLDVAKLENVLAPAVAFARKHRVPVFIGEFAVTRNSGEDDSYQARATAERIRLFEQYGFHWTYWNYRETTHLDSMALQVQKADGSDYPVNQPQLDVLRAGWRLNGRESRQEAEKP